MKRNTLLDLVFFATVTFAIIGVFTVLMAIAGTVLRILNVL